MVEDVQVLIQCFFCSLPARKSLRQVGPQRGKFRSFLLASLKNYLSDEFDRKRSIKRGGHLEFVALDFDDGEERYREDAIDSLTAEKIFDARWAMTLLAEAGKRRPADYRLQGKAGVV